MAFNHKHFIFLLLIIIVSSAIAQISEDPYKVLGLNRHASNQDIRKAYKQLAKEWHPDKNSHPDAELKFVQIKKAYELLSDSDRRRLYDQHGVTNEDSHMYKQKHDYSNYGRFATDPLEEFFGKQFHFDHDISIYHKLSVTTNYYEQTILEKSRSVPYILMFYNDWCFRCTRLVGAFKKLIDILEPLGVQFATVNAAHEQRLFRTAGLNDLPSLVFVLNGHNYVYRESTISAQKVVEFIRKKLPYRIAVKVDDSNIDDFLNGWMDNKVRALILEPRNQTRLRYLLAAFQFRNRVQFGFVQLDSGNCREIKERFQIHPNLDTLLIFNEYVERPVASVSMADIPTQTLNSIISSNQYLMLPRLSSQEILEGICPAEWNRPRKRLCVVLITENSEEHNFARGALRNIALQSAYSLEKVRFAYIYKEKQLDFINAISQGSENEKLLRIVVLWRRDTSHIKYEWVHDASLDLKDHPSSDHLINHTKQQIDQTVQKLLKTSEALSYEAFVKNLLDEHAQGFIHNWINKIFNVYDYLMDTIEEEHVLAALSLLGTIAFMFAVGYVMVYFVRAEEENLKAKGELSPKGGAKANRQQPELRLHELRAEKYNGLIRLLKPGCRTIILITDLQTRPKLIPPFHKAVWPYRKNKTLMFGHMLIDKGLSWYSELLRQGLGDTKTLHINPRNCVGTVLALNGHRKYFCMYHAKHPETTRGVKRMEKITRQLIQRPDDPEIGAFFNPANSDDSDDTEPKVLLEGNLLDGLSNWLDRLFEGSTHRYYINYWPEFPTK